MGKTLLTMLQKITDSEKYGLLGLAVVLLAVGFTAGNLFHQLSNPTGKVVDKGSGDKKMIKEKVGEFLDQQMGQQRKQLKMIANQSENLSQDDIGISAEVGSVNPSRFESLYAVNVSVQGKVPKQIGGGTREVNQENVVYISKDGRYLFQKPKDLEAKQEQRIPVGR